MQEFFRDIFDYTHQCNEQSIALLSSLGDRLPSKCALLQSHMLNAHQIWNNRIVPEQKPFGVWDLHPVAEWMEINESNYQKTLSIIHDVSPDEVIHYRNSKGDSLKGRAGDILFHIVNHSTYHRGQIALLLRQHDIDPVMSDYIHVKR